LLNVRVARNNHIKCVKNPELFGFEFEAFCNTLLITEIGRVKISHEHHTGNQCGEDLKRWSAQITENFLQDSCLWYLYLSLWTFCLLNCNVMVMVWDFVL